MKSSTARLSRRALDRRLAGAAAALRVPPPPAGWIRAIRDALGMSAADLSRRMGVSGATVSDIERSERDGRVRLDTLGRAADALDCDLVYVLVPRTGLDDFVRRTAMRRVREQVAAVDRGMDLEAQSTTIDESAVLAEVERLIDSGLVWK
ncbi:transcriptional regulator [Pilimelia anulata]|uniref:Transcriptional regulator n=1 Tax=Pilimelia anulata TaxID=53371 RepID=A0A8J3F900_9ACTN|nr:mobile mystery protein A [Pilimelia anulata]GGJ82659.1 transcriptional regulator [Pilimelia anulata]